MLENYTFLSLASYFVVLIILLSVHIQTRPKGAGIVPQDFFLIFFMIQYGPHALFPGDNMLRLGMLDSLENNLDFIKMLVCGYIGLTIGYFLSSFSAKSFGLATSVKLSVKAVNPSRFIMYMGIVYIAFFVVVQGPTLPILRENISFLLGNSSFNYLELRRVIFVDNLYTTVANAFRQNMTAVIFSLLVLEFYKQKKMVFLILAATVYIICAAQLNKFPLIYFLLLSFFVIFAYKNQAKIAFKMTAFRFFMILFAIVSVFQLLNFLYQVQYAHEVANGILSEEDLVNVIPYRLFYASNDGLRLWLEYFPAATDFIGFANIKPIAGLMGERFFQPTVEVPTLFMGNDLTTIQAGFIGAGYAGFGFYGVIVFGCLVGMITNGLSFIGSRIADPELRSIWVGLVGLNTMFLGTRELHTALASGGVIFAPIAIVLLYKLFFKRYLKSI